MAKLQKVKKVKKPWGSELWYAHGEHYLGKIIVIEKGRRLSLQYHKKKHETVYALRGRWVLRISGKRILMRPGYSMAIAPKTIHRFEAPYGRATLLEVSTPQAADVVRLEDDYGRSAKSFP